MTPLPQYLSHRRLVPAPGAARQTRLRYAVAVLVLCAVVGCKPGGKAGGGVGDASGQAPSGCVGGCAAAAAAADPNAARLTVDDVQTVLARALFEASSRGVNATIAVTDRVGNVLGVVRRGPARTVTVSSERGVTGGLEGAAVPDTLASISKAITASYLSSEGNAFTTRTANQIVQEYFNPGEIGQPSGPLYGVQFSQLPCSDLTVKPTALPPGVLATQGPQRAPLGLSADPGGLPLYKSGTPVGGIGVVVDSVYGVDLNIDDATANDRDQNNPALNNFRNLDEIVALAGTRGFEAPVDRRADRITAGGLTLRFADAALSDLTTSPTNAPAFDAGTLVNVAAPLYFAGTVVAGKTFGAVESGFAPADDDFVAPASGARTLDAFVLVDGTGVNRYPPTAGSALSQAEVKQLLKSAITVANRSRAQIRRPTGSQVRVTVSVVDTDGTILGLARTRDAPVFGTDVSLQKARTAAFFSRADAAASLAAAGLAAYATDTQAMATGTTFADGVAFTPRAIGNLARPFFPDGVSDKSRGPLSVDYTTHWSPFNVGVQLDLLTTATGAAGLADGTSCGPTGIGTRLANGLQIFPGGVPIYRGSTLVGALGVSGDGVDQDDMVAFLGVNNAGIALGTGIGNAAPANRADADPSRYLVRNSGGVPVGSTNVRYVQCPYAPFLDSGATSPCDGL